MLEHATFLVKLSDNKNNSYKNQYCLKMESVVIKLDLQVLYLREKQQLPTTATDKCNDDDSSKFYCFRSLLGSLEFCKFFLIL
jgi:hypothetical protein